MSDIFVEGLKERLVTWQICVFDQLVQVECCLQAKSVQIPDWRCMQLECGNRLAIVAGTVGCPWPWLLEFGHACKRADFDRV